MGFPIETLSLFLMIIQTVIAVENFEFKGETDMESRINKARCNTRGVIGYDCGGS